MEKPGEMDPMSRRARDLFGDNGRTCVERVMATVKERAYGVAQ